ncbi:serine hydrolase [Algoriphagus lacus]|uniref:Serine hydrolase n=1 Tax=Algoriphagus lacus TaxID=2056311 RepID=A0A418PNE3_9BACT|nr:serine hydrolase [Algoriphagus lacus]RIW13405.1 serine hydrolase [Algoriphagus lacus]
MKYLFSIIALLVAHLTYGQVRQSSAAEVSEFGTSQAKSIEAELDAIFKKAYPSNSPGATVLVSKDDQIIYRKAFGMANLELNVPMKPDNVLKLASITKQFTSVAILILMEQGKLSLDDPLSKYISDFPRGSEITIHHLLNHTSGIKDYTRIPELRDKTRLDISPEDLISNFKDLPLEFNPNEKYDYNNSGYVLLGYIIEKISGLSYGDFINENIFKKIGMNNSSYADNYKIIPNKAVGYGLFEGNFENAEYMSPSFPYAAGSLISTIDDMFLWNKAIQDNTLISEKSKQLAFTNHKLNTGKPSNYGYGWFINEIAGLPTVEHTGGINGFTTSGIYVPDSKIYSIVLSNLDDGIGAANHNLKAVSALLGKPIEKKVALKISEEELKKWEGAYQFEDVVRFISFEEGVLFSAREGGRPMKLEPLSNSEFSFENSFSTYKFSTVNGKRQVLFSDRIIKAIGIETDIKPISNKDEINLPKEILVNYVGVYELQPGFQIEIKVQNDRLIAMAAGQPAVELFAKTENTFYIKEIGAQLVFNKDSDGIINSLTFAQGGNKMEGKKIK